MLKKNTKPVAAAASRVTIIGKPANSSTSMMIRSVVVMSISGDSGLGRERGIDVARRRLTATE